MFLESCHHHSSINQNSSQKDGGCVSEAEESIDQEIHFPPPLFQDDDSSCFIDDPSPNIGNQPIDLGSFNHVEFLD